MRVLLIGSLLLGAIFTMPAHAQRTVVFPQFASGGGWSSEFVFVNQGLSQLTGITVSFFDDTGNPLSVNSSLGANSSFSFALNMGATQLISITSSDALASGYATATYPTTDAAIRASLILRCEQNGALYSEIGLPQQEQGVHFSFSVENSATYPKTAIALVNPMSYNAANSTAQTVILNLINSDGTLQSTRQVPLQTGAHLARYIDELFPNLGSFTGSMSVSSPFGVGALALRQETNSFYPIATDGGPILGPFMLTKTVVPEVEPNDASATARLISGLTYIAGTIGQAGDQDVYKFTGKAGDVVSVICTTQGLASDLDSVIEIYDSKMNLIAMNDQNGLAPNLYPQNDSFVQAALPANDTYYIVVRDYWEDSGGATYAYRLHAKLP
jgi:hypothetical protein